MRRQRSNTASGRAESATLPGSRFERHPWLTLIISVLALLAIVVCAVEWSLTLLHDRLDLGVTKIDGEPRVLRLREWAPGTAKMFAAPENRFNDPIGPVDREYELRVDKEGFIWPSIVHQKPDLEIAFLGGSTTECLLVRPTMRFPHLAGRMLEQHTGLKINALNAGKSGNTSMHAVLNYLGKVAPRRPRFVVLMQATNDSGFLNREKTYWSDEKGLSLVVPEQEIKVRSPIELFVRRVRDHTIPYTYRLVRRGLNGLAQSLSQINASRSPSPQAAPAFPPEGFIATPDEAQIQRRKLLRTFYEPALRSFVRLAKAWGSEPVLMTQVLVREGGDGGASDFLSPEELLKGNFDTASFASMHDYANAIVRHVAASEGALLIDLVSARQWTRDDVYDGLHFTETGSRHVAEIIDSALTPLILKSDSKPQMAAPGENLGAER